MNGMLLLAALGAALSNFPRDAGGRIAHAGIAVHLGGGPAVVVAAGEKVVAFRPDGSAVPLFSLSGGEEDQAAGAPAAGDMGGDGRVVIAVATASGKLFLWSGGLVSGFPAKLGARARAGASFADVDGDGRPEVLVGDERGRLHAFKRNGREANGWPASLGCVVTSTASSSVFAGGRSVAVGCEDGKVHVLDGVGRERPGFPLATKFSVTGAPAFADLDDDGEMDLVVASQDFGVYAVNAKGKPLPGFPVKAGYRIYQGPAIADLDGDGRLDVAFASADGMIHAVSASGEKLPGFPVRVGARIFGGVAVGDLDRDGGLDLVAATADGSLAAVDAKGRPLAGFPVSLPADVTATPVLHDLGGTLAAFVGAPGGQLHAVRFAGAGSAAPRIAWAGSGRDAAQSGRFGPNPPSYKDLALSPAEPRALDALKASWRGVWLDAGRGETAPAPRVEWRRNGKAVAALEGKKELPPGTVKRGERWRFVLTSPKGDAVAEGREVPVLDTAPTAPGVALEPAVPNRATDVRVRIVKPAVDPDGDPLTYRIAWLLDGLETGVTGELFPADRLKRSGVLAARVVASDGELGGPAGAAQARVGDTPPGPLEVSLEPAAPGRAEPVRARIDAPATDPDGDPLVYRYAWKVDGQPRNLPASTSVLPAGLFRKHQKVEVEARAFDGELAGPPARAEVAARNTPPTAPKIEIRPARPRRGDALHAVLAAPAEDADGDALAYKFTWRKNGAPFAAPGDGREVPGSDVAKADAFELTVTASDGEAAGPAATARVTVANTPPVPPRIAIEPRRPRGGEPLRLVVLEPARDADGDRVSLDIAWSRDGKPTGSRADSLPPSQLAKHERVKVIVTPRDGEEEGAPVADEVVVDDAPPSAPGVAFATERPTVGAPLRAVVRTPAQDPDGDAVRYQYRWFRDGAPVALADGTPESRAAPFWTSASEVPASELKKGQRWTVEVRAHDGERPGPAARAAVAVVNSPPPAPRLLFAPERPRRVDGIAVVVEQPPDPDGDVITHRYAWTRNGSRWDAPPGQAQVPRGVARKGERWAVEVVASDGEAESPPVRHETVIADTAPGPLAAALCDGPVPAGTVPQARVAAPSSDPDGDAVSYRHEWTVNGKPVPAMSGQTRLTAPALKKHDRVRVTVTPWDGELAGPPAFAECEVANTPPGPPAVALEPAEPTAPRGVAVAVRKPSADRDQDPVSYRYAWWRDGVPFRAEGASIPPGTLRHGELWRVEVTPFDGEEEGERVVLQAVVKNTPPPVPSVVLAPASAAAGEPLTCDARAPERDADQEQVTLRYRWFRNGKPEAFAEGSPNLPARVLRRGESWRCEAWSFDGAAESGRAGAELVVRNTPPSAPQVAIEPERPHRGDDLYCRIATPSADADGDTVSYAYGWTENDRPAQAGADPARIDGSRVAKGRRWRCTATPSDGTAAGAPASAAAVVANSPPGPLSVRLEPAAPRQGQALRCEVVVKSEDPDGDAVRYRFAWQRNGAAQPFAESSQEVPQRLVRAGDRWRCTVTPSDGSEDGPPAGSEEVLVLPPADERRADVR
jgi:outer membrane protein assembly factor BamB